MDSEAATTLHTQDDPAADRREIVRLRRRLERERASRVEAEDISERATADLYSSLQELRQLHDVQDDAMRRLRDLDHAKDAFLSTVSHELRTPLTSMIAYLEMIEDGDIAAGPPMEAAVDAMSRNAHRLQHLVEELLTFSALQHDEEVLVLECVDLVALLEEAHASLLPAVRQRGLLVAAVTEGAVPMVEADRGLLLRLILNLLDNAIKFTPSGGRISTRLACDDNGVLLEVADTGIGIAADEQALLFASFYRAARSVAEETRGTGLGLALVQAVAERHHGSVALTSVEGEGTVVSVRLPLKPPAPSAALPIP